MLRAQSARRKAFKRGRRLFGLQKVNLKRHKGRHKRTKIKTCPSLLCVPNSQRKRRREQHVRLNKNTYHVTPLHSPPLGPFLLFSMYLVLPLLLHPRRVCPPLSLQVHGLQNPEDATEKLKNKAWGAHQPKLSKISRLVFPVCSIVACREDRVHKAGRQRKTVLPFLQMHRKQFFLFLKMHAGHSAPQGRLQHR